MGEHLCIVPNVEPEFSRMPISKSHLIANGAILRI